MTATQQVEPGAAIDPESLIETVAVRLADPEQMAAQSVQPTARARVSTDGSAGVASFYAELARHDRTWLKAAHAHLAAAAGALDGTYAAGLHLGPAAVLAGAQSCASLGGHYPRLRRKLLEWVCAEQHRCIAEQRARRAKEPGVGWESYDVILGLTGPARLLLTAATSSATEDERQLALSALRATLDCLVSLSEPVRAGPHTVPGWWVPGPRQPSEADRRAYPEGDFNLGMAHGIPGPLTLLSMCAQRDILVDGMKEAIHREAEWLVGWALRDEAGPYWAWRVALPDEIGRTQNPDHVPESPMTRAAWCYGAPGVAVSLLRAGAAMGRPEWRKLAMESLHAIFRRPEHDWNLDGATVCHGYAGLLHVLCRVGRAEQDAELLAHTDRLAGRVAGFADPSAPFLFRHLQPGQDHEGWDLQAPLEPVDIAGLVDGAAGVAAALLTLLRPDAGEAGWDSVLLLT